MEKGQLKEELQKMRMAYQQIYEEKEMQSKEFERQINNLKQ